MTANLSIEFRGTMADIKVAMREFLGDAAGPATTETPELKKMFPAGIPAIVPDPMGMGTGTTMEINADGAGQVVESALKKAIGAAQPQMAQQDPAGAQDQTAIQTGTGAQDQTAIQTGTGAQAGLELDMEGFPWDARINTANKSKTAKGVWKRKPGLGKGVYDQVRTELRANITTPATQSQVNAVEHAAAGQAQVNASAGATTGPVMGWADFLREITVHGLDPVTVQNACVAAGVANAVELENNPGVIPQVAAALGLTGVS